MQHFTCDVCGKHIEGPRGQAMDVFTSQVNPRILARFSVELHIDGRMHNPDLCAECRASIFDKLGAPYAAPETVEATQ